MPELEKSDSGSPTPLPTRGYEIIGDWLKSRLVEIEKKTDKDVLTISGPIQAGVAVKVRLALDRINERKNVLLVILHTLGGTVEETKLIVETLRHFYPNGVHFLVPIQAMSAGTVLVMSGDKIYMDYFSKLGPIDPQILKGDSYVPGLSYLHQYDNLIKKDKKGELTNVDAILLQKLDLAELHSIELAKNLSIKLITEWLPKYKFKDLQKKDLQKKDFPASMEDKNTLAKEIAQKLSDQDNWFVHSYGIHKDVLEEDLGLKIDDYSTDLKLKELVWNYFWGVIEYAGVNSFVHNKVFI